MTWQANHTPLRSVPRSIYSGSVHQDGEGYISFIDNGNSSTDRLQKECLWLVGQGSVDGCIGSRSVGGWLDSKPAGWFDRLTDRPNNERTNRQAYHWPSIILID